MLAPERAAGNTDGRTRNREITGIANGDGIAALSERTPSSNRDGCAASWRIRFRPATGSGVWFGESDELNHRRRRWPGSSVYEESQMSMRYWVSSPMPTGVSRSSGRYGEPSRERAGSTYRKLPRSQPWVMICCDPFGATSISRATQAMSDASVTAQNRSSDGPARRRGCDKAEEVNVSPDGWSIVWSSGTYGANASGPSLPDGTEAPAVG